ncbi:MAG: hypothetical protein ACREDF_00365 [Thermoplasmata archaeon]
MKSENLLRHLNDIHPRHPDVPKLVEELKREPGRIVTKKASRPFRVRRLHVTIILVVVLLGVGGFYLLPYLSPPSSLPCVSGEGRTYHWHTDLSIDSGGSPVTIPANVGISFTCMRLLHTHDANGRIHIEPDTPEQNRLYTIGEFFQVWGKSFGSPTVMHVNGTLVTPSPGVVLYDNEQIHIGYASFAA